MSQQGVIDFRNRRHAYRRALQERPKCGRHWPELAAVPFAPPYTLPPGASFFAQRDVAHALWTAFEIIADYGGPVVPVHGGASGVVVARWAFPECLDDRGEWNWDQRDVARWRRHWRKLYALPPELRASWSAAWDAAGEEGLAAVRAYTGGAVFRWPWAPLTPPKGRR